MTLLIAHMELPSIILLVPALVIGLALESWPKLRRLMDHEQERQSGRS